MVKLFLILLLNLLSQASYAFSVNDPGNPPGWNFQKDGPHPNAYYLRSAFSLRVIEKWIELLKKEYPGALPYVAVEKRTFGFREDGMKWYASWTELEPVIAEAQKQISKYEALRLTNVKEWRTPAILGEPHQHLTSDEMYAWLKKYVLKKECKLIEETMGEHPELQARCQKFYFTAELGGRFHFILSRDGQLTVEGVTTHIQDHWNSFLLFAKHPYPTGTPGAVKVRRGPYLIDEPVDVQRTH